MLWFLDTGYRGGSLQRGGRAQPLVDDPPMVGTLLTWAAATLQVEDEGLWGRLMAHVSGADSRGDWTAADMATVAGALATQGFLSAL